MLGQIKDDNTRLSLLGNYLENIKGTVFRQTQFAEFELRMHEMAAKGQPITGDSLAKLYLDITRRYYGHDPVLSEVEIGWTFLARRCWGGAYNREVKRLMLDHALLSDYVSIFGS